MTGVVVAWDEPHGERLALELAREGVDVVATVPTALLDESALARADVVILDPDSPAVRAELVARCDRAGVRLLALAASEAAERLARSIGVEHVLPVSSEPWRIAAALADPHPTTGPLQRPATRVIAVWGPHGAPGRSTIAVQVAVELARGGRTVALVDADTHAPSVSIALGLEDEAPGFAAACRRFEHGGLDSAELARISVALRVADGRVEVLTGINRPSRWPELSERRVAGALAACRHWCDDILVDVAASLERDEEIVSDLEGPRRNAATLAVLAEADVVVAVCSADPVGMARFIRGFAELRALVGPGRIVVVANRLRPGGLGIDSRGQIRRALDRFAGVRDVAFLPLDPRSVDAAVLAARPVAEVAPRSPFVQAVRRLVGQALAPERVQTKTLMPRR